MKYWTIILGKGGTILIAIGLALLIFSVIPQLQVSEARGGGGLSPEQARITFRPWHLLPLQEMEVAATVEEGGFLKVYLLDMGTEVQYFNGVSHVFNVTDLQEFLEEHPDQIVWEDQVENGNYKRSYFPTRAMNATVVFCNPKSEIAYLDYKVTLQISLGPADQVRSIAACTTPLGALMVLPWQVNLRKQRKHK